MSAQGVSHFAKSNLTTNLPALANALLALDDREACTKC